MARVPILKRLIECSMCSGFWTGLFLGIVWQLVQGDDFSVVLTFFYGFSVSFLGNFIDLTMKALDEWIQSNRQQK